MFIIPLFLAAFVTIPVAAGRLGPREVPKPDGVDCVKACDTTYAITVYKCSKENPKLVPDLGFPIDACTCTKEVAQNMDKCFNCQVVSPNVDADPIFLQKLSNEFITQCAAAGFPLPGITVAFPSAGGSVTHTAGGLATNVASVLAATNTVPATNAPGTSQNPTSTIAPSPSSTSGSVSNHYIPAVVVILLSANTLFFELIL